MDDLAAILAEVQLREARRSTDDLAALRADPDEYHSDKAIRCPACGWRTSPAQADLYELYADGGHDVSCQRCDHDFRVVVKACFTFLSPAGVPHVG